MTQLSQIVISKQDLGLLQQTNDNLKICIQTVESKQAEYDKLISVETELNQNKKQVWKAIGARQFIIDLIQQNYKLPDESKFDVITGIVTLPSFKENNLDGIIVDV